MYRRKGNKRQVPSVSSPLRPTFLGTTGLGLIIHTCGLCYLHVVIVSCQVLAPRLSRGPLRSLHIETMPSVLPVPLLHPLLQGLEPTRPTEEISHHAMVLGLRALSLRGAPFATCVLLMFIRETLQPPATSHSHIPSRQGNRQRERGTCPAFTTRSVAMR